MPITITSLLPTAGPTAGSLIVVRGTNFINSLQLHCSVGTSMQLVATWTSTTEIRCQAPAQAPGSVAVEVTNNNQDYSSEGVMYTYQANAAVTSVSNSHGPVTGGTLITVTGSNFVNSPQLRCRFYLDILPGTWLTASTVLCQTVAHAREAVSVEVSNNDQDYTASGAVFYTFDRT